MSNIDPKLLNPAKARLQILESASNLNIDEVYGEPEESGDDLYVEDPNNPGNPLVLEIYCQWVPVDDLALTPVHGGDSPSSRGYILVKTKDMEKIWVDHGEAIKKGDLILTVGGEAVNGVVTEVENHSHYGGSPRIKFIRYEDRQQGV
jgi:hypothetical protein